MKNYLLRERERETGSKVENDGIVMTVGISKTFE